jgi:hypothetical protein
MTFRYPAKGGIERDLGLTDAAAARGRRPRQRPWP